MPDLPLKILILRFSSLGDIIMTTAMLRSVRETFPHAQIDMIVRSDFIDLIQNNPHLDKKIAFPRDSGARGLWRILKIINRESYDLVYDAHRSLRTLLLMPWVKLPRKVFIRKNYFWRSLALTFKFPKLTDKTRMLERFNLPLMDMGVVYDGEGPEIFPEKSILRNLMARFGLSPQKTQTIIGFIPSAQWPGKRWPTQNFREVLKGIIETSLSTVIIFGGKNDTFCQEISSGMPQSRVVNTQGLLSLKESIALLSLCTATLANDTGLMHVADALGIPTVLVLGPTSSELGCLPFHPKSIVLEHPMWCRPCSKNGQAPCIRTKRHCLLKTTPADALKAIDSLADGLDQEQNP